MRPLGPGARLVDGVHVVAHLHRSNVLDVYDAWCERRRCRVAVKCLRPDRRGDARAARALLREGRLLCRLAHPHLARGYEVHVGERPAVVLETLTGETLSHLFERSRRPFGARELGHLGLQVGSALAYLHSHDVVHLDIKPSNVVVDAGRAKVLDLSIARRPGRVPAGTGTWCNMAPEQARGGPAGPPADAWALGLLLHEAATGANPFADDDEHDHPQLHHGAPALSSARPRLPRELTALVDACLEPEPGARPAFDDALAVLAEVAEPEGSAWARPKAPRRGRRVAGRDREPRSGGYRE